VARLARVALSLALLALAAGPGSATASLSDVVATASRSVVVVETTEGQGSAFAVTDDGEFLTNAHVVGDSSEVVIVDSEGREETAEVVAIDEAGDVARLESSLEVPALETADGLPRPGDAVIAIGAPGGLGGTVTKGIVSALRDLDGTQVIQTDVAINPGNSGGPLLSEDGEVLGVNTAKGVDQEGIAFALPIEAAQRSVATADGSGPAPDEPASATWRFLGFLALAVVLGLAALLLRRRRRAAGVVVRAVPPRPAPAPAEEEPLVIVRRRRNSDETSVTTTHRSESEWT
jgi:S1-C subfamily serine protease